MLPIAEDKAGAYTCKVTVGTAVSAESASSAITTTGLSLGTLHFHKYIQLTWFITINMTVYGSVSKIQYDVCFNVGFNQESLKGRGVS